MGNSLREGITGKKIICAFIFVSTLSASTARLAVRHSNLAAKYCHMNKSTFEGGKWCPRKFNWKKWFVYAFVYQGLAQALQHPAAVGHSVLVTMYCHVIKSTSYGGKWGVWEDVTGKVMCTHFFFTNTTCDKKREQQQMQTMVYNVIPNTVQIPALYSLQRRSS